MSAPDGVLNQQVFILPTQIERTNQDAPLIMPEQTIWASSCGPFTVLHSRGGAISENKPRSYDFRKNSYHLVIHVHRAAHLACSSPSATSPHSLKDDDIKRGRCDFRGKEPIDDKDVPRSIACWPIEYLRCYGEKKCL